MTDHVIIQYSTTTSTTWRQKWENRASLLIRAILHGSPFSHCSFVLGDEAVLDATDSPDAPILLTTPPGNPRGVALRPHDYQEWGTRRRMVLHCPNVADAIIATAMTQLGKPFDSSAVSFRSFIDTDTFPRDKPWNDPAAWWCSEYITWSEECGGLWDHPLIFPKQRISPIDNLMLHVTDSRFVNRRIFWSPVPGLKRGRYEI
jgi:hypothetical protein